MKRLRILHFGKYYYPHRGGIETVVQELCEGLAKRGVDVTALVSNEEAVESIDWIKGVRVLRMARQAELASQPINPCTLGTLRKTPFDLLHFHTPNPLGAALSLLGRRGRPLVVSHHSEIVRQRALGGFATAVQRRLYLKSAAVVVATPLHVAHSRCLRGLEQRCRVIHYPIAPEPFAAAPRDWDSALPGSWRTQPLALFVGRLVYYKGVDVLLKALVQVPDLRLSLVGDGPLRADLENLSYELGLADRVRFLGDVTEQRLRALYRSARCLVLPSVAASEAFGMVQLEAFAAGTAVISTALKSGVPYVNQHGLSGLVVEPGSVQALTQALSALSHNAELAAKLGHYGQARVFREFHTDQVADQHLSLYESILSNTPRASA